MKVRGREIDVTRREVRLALAIGIIGGILAVPAVATLSSMLAPSSISNNVTVSGDTVYAAEDGPTVTLTGSTEVNLSEWNPNQNNVTLRTADGNVTFVSAGKTYIDVRVDELNTAGGYTRLSNLSVASSDLFIRADNKPDVTIAGDVRAFNWTDPVVDDGAEDFSYRGPSGSTTVRIGGLPAGEVVSAVDADTGEVLAADEASAGGRATFANMPNSGHSVRLQTSDDTTGDPIISNVKPRVELTGEPDFIGYYISDPDFDSGDSVNVDTILNGTTIDSRTVSSDTQVTLTDSAWGSLDNGTHTVTIVATDSSGNQVQRTYEFYTPDELAIRTASPQYGLIDDRQVTVTFEYRNQSVTRTTTDGTVGLADLSTTPISARVTAPYFTNGTLRFDKTWQKQTVYLVNTNTTSTADIRFLLEDRTGGTYANNNATLEIQKPINNTYTTVVSSEFGPRGTVAELETGQQYRLKIRNDLGDNRLLGSYTPTGPETVTLQVGEFGPMVNASDGDFLYNISYVSRDGLQNLIKLQYSDPDNETDYLSVRIHERGNQSNVLLSNTTFAGPYGNYSLTKKVPSKYENATWVVDVTVNRANETTAVREIVGPGGAVLQNMPWWLRAFVAFGSILMVAGLFSRINGDIGGVVVAAMGGIWWFVGFLPSSVGVGVVVLAMAIAGILFVNARRGGAPA